jgi:two-component system nitrogen regulation response regulator GlnG
VFLDEVGDLAMGSQAKLLRVLQEKQLARVGGNATIPCDIRVIAATNQDLEALAAVDRFRQDLFYRLNVLTIRIPALRERIEDIPLLLKYFLARMNRELGRNVRGVSPEAMQLLQRHRWPGNVRELQSAVMYALVLANGDTLTADCLPRHLLGKSPQGEALAAKQDVDLAVGRMAQELLAAERGDLYYEVQAAVDRAILREVLDHVKGNQVEAAELLGISRTTLRAKIRRLKMVIAKQVNAAE